MSHLDILIHLPASSLVHLNIPPSTQRAKEAIYNVNLTVPFLCPKSVILKAAHGFLARLSCLMSHDCSQNAEGLLKNTALSQN